LQYFRLQRENTRNHITHKSINVKRHDVGNGLPLVFDAAYENKRLIRYSFPYTPRCCTYGQRTKHSSTTHFWRLPECGTVVIFYKLSVSFCLKIFSMCIMRKYKKNHYMILRKKIANKINRHHDFALSLWCFSLFPYHLRRITIRYHVDFLRFLRSTIEMVEKSLILIGNFASLFCLSSLLAYTFFFSIVICRYLII
jgi:hypothetical protein